MSKLEEALEAMDELLKYSNALNAKLSALEVLTDALIGTIGKSLPPLLGPLQENLRQLAEVKEEELPKAIRQGFRAHVEDAGRRIDAMKVQGP
ncbi:MAG: hypothetical protein J7605_17300 [Variovorax sp.]|nr:hypothetical protein [Variovorax sp.]